MQDDSMLERVARGFNAHRMAIGVDARSFDNLGDRERSELLVAIAVGLSRLTADDIASLLKSLKAHAG